MVLFLNVGLVGFVVIFELLSFWCYETGSKVPSD